MSGQLKKGIRLLAEGEEGGVEVMRRKVPKVVISSFEKIKTTHLH